MLHEQPGRKQTREEKHLSLNEQPRSTTCANWIAFASGLLLGFLTTNSGLIYLGKSYLGRYLNVSDTSFPPWTAWLPFQLPSSFFLLLPLALGVIIPFTMDIQREKLISCALGRSLLVWVGVSIYWSPLVIYAEDKWNQEALYPCMQTRHYAFCGLHLFYAGLSSYLSYIFFSSITLLLFVLITTLMRKFNPWNW